MFPTRAYRRRQDAGSRTYRQQDSVITRCPCALRTDGRKTLRTVTGRIKSMRKMKVNMRTLSSLSVIYIKAMYKALKLKINLNAKKADCKNTLRLVRRHATDRSPLGVKRLRKPKRGGNR
ncbi:hypothetical protein NDU88_005442 [Pleurodeles waltl]|uniref:60S ribosomal protein L28 n=1 Tax=Pleurodeles waltl TaxID=8319 RepID=A0AAV7WAG0_PLEWA|nr:hypothetical protein NDU88_005442 [Pleurodeles waltl]